MKNGILKENYKTIDLSKRLLDIIIVASVGFILFLCNTPGIRNSFWGYLPTGILLTIVCFNIFPLYKAWRGFSLLSELIIVLYALITTFIVFVLIIFFTGGIDIFFRKWIINWFILSLFILILYRICLKFTLNYFRKTGFNQRSVCLISYGEYGKSVFQTITRKRIFGFDVLAVFADKVDGESNEYGDKFKGKIKDAYKWLASNEIDQIWIVVPFEKIEIVKNIMLKTENLIADIRYFPDMNSLNLINHSVSEVGNIPCFNLSMSPIDTAGSKFIKRIEDLFIGILIMILLSPLMFLIFAVIKITSSGSVIHRQIRVGFNNKTFRMYKFRTMPIDIEDETGAVWAKAGEKRATLFGAFLRKTSLDELPQLFNVVKGNMSLVGPRPERPEFVEKFKSEIPLYMKKHMVKAGMTGWAQINGYRGNTDLKKRIEYDIYYIENWSILFDIKILLLTVFKGFINKNAY